MQKYIPELLKEINDNPALLTQLRGDASLTLLFGYAFDPSQKFILPEGDAPYKPDSAPIGMTPANLRMELKKLYVFCRTDLKAVRRESLYIQLLESIHPSEAEILVAIKDQDLPRLYPNITHQLVYENGFVKVPPEVNSKPKKVVKDQITDAVTVQKRGRGRPKKDLGVTANP